MGIFVSLFGGTTLTIYEVSTAPAPGELEFARILVFEWGLFQRTTTHASVEMPNKNEIIYLLSLLFMKAIKNITLLSVIVFGGFAAEPKSKLDLAAPAAIAKPTHALPHVDRLEVHLSGPKPHVERGSALGKLSKEAPDWILTSKSDIARVLAMLRPNEGQKADSRPPISDGVTYHLLAYNDEKGTMMHIRVFYDGDDDESGSRVYLQPENNVGYRSDQIGPWLSAKIPYVR